MRIRLTHVALPSVGSGLRFSDALGVVDEVDVDGPRRVFVPGWLPCGECGRCRRALVSACESGRALLPEPLPRTQTTVDLPDRFVTPIDTPPEAARLADAIAARAGVAATLVDATASAGLTPGDIAIWIGGDFFAEAGAAFAAARGCNAYWMPGDDADRPAAPGVTVLPAKAAVVDWLAALASADAAGPPGRRARRIFLTESAPALLTAAGVLADPGATIAWLADARARITDISLPARARLLALGGYHPDFVVEGLAALRRGELPLVRLEAALEVLALA
jgi:hypothetical protein